MLENVAKEVLKKKKSAHLHLILVPSVEESVSADICDFKL